ncbi:MAG: endopeptidase La, partial [Elusimicrobia bacterium]|nr:endopeptidase La [Elusimicrobiota bacterium]
RIPKSAKTVARRPSARAALDAAAAEAKNRASSEDGGSRSFDGAGSNGGSAGGGGSGGPLAPYDGPPEAPVITFQKIYFPGVYQRSFRVAPGTPAALQVREALANGGWAIAATSGGSTKQGHNATAALARFTNPVRDGEGLKVSMEILRPVRINGYAQAPKKALMAKVSYPPVRPGDARRLASLAATAKLLVREYSSVDPESIPEDLVAHVLAEQNPARAAGMLAEELPLHEAVKLRLLEAPSTESMMEDLILETAAMLQAKRAAARAAPSASSAADGGAPPEDQGNLDTLEGLQAKMKAIGMPEDVQKTAVKEFEKLAQMNPKDSEAQKIRTYLEWLTEVPWSRRTQDVFDVAKAREIMDADHYGLDKVKERILEFLAVRKRTGSLKGAILCFVGPPGVGKTSIAASIAKAVGRRFVRLSLGGVHDTAELRGHGRTYVGSQPGALIRQMKAAGTINPVMLLDEVDKLGREGNHGDPTAALLEILDPAQNNTFRDHYLDVPYDLSQTLFIVTANDISSIPEPLRDRMEIIQFNGYTPQEKVGIAERHLVPRALKEAGLKPEEAAPTKAALLRIVEGYTLESGVRKLGQKIEELMRKISAWIETRGEPVPGTVDEAAVEKYLGQAPMRHRETAENDVGMATGLAVNDHGGSTLNVEVVAVPGTGRLQLRRQMLEMIDDSAHNAYAYVKTNAEALGLKDFDFSKVDLEIAFTPAGKIDGPSAGTAMTTAIISRLTGRAVKPGIAMTGEITMTGRVLPIGGLPQKVMAAHRMGYKTVFFPAANERDVAEIPQEVRDGIELVPVKSYDEILKRVLAPAAQNR